MFETHVQIFTFRSDSFLKFSIFCDSERPGTELKFPGCELVWDQTVTESYGLSKLKNEPSMHDQLKLGQLHNGQNMLALHSCSSKLEIASISYDSHYKEMRSGIQLKQWRWTEGLSPQWANHWNRSIERKPEPCSTLDRFKYLLVLITK